MSKYRDAILVGGVLLLILGLRIFVGIRFVINMPRADDFTTIAWLQQWSEGIHNWAFIWQRDNGHPMVLYFLANLGQYLLNGYWDARLDFLVFALVHTAYAALVILTFRNVLTSSDRGWLLALIFLLFAVPFAGRQSFWGNLWPHSAMMTFSLWALYLAAFHGQKWSHVLWICILTALASINMAAGCLAGLMVASLTIFRAALARQFTNQDKVVSIICFAIFIGQFPFQLSGNTVGFGQSIYAFLKVLGWPTVFIPGIGLLTLVPLAGLVAAQIFIPSFRQKNVAFITGAGGLIVMMAVATGACRGYNNNMGMPADRYTDIFIMVPLICAVALCLLYRGLKGWSRRGCEIFAIGWLCVQFLGFSIHIFYHVIPFVMRESGEWLQGQKQVQFRDLVRGSGQISTRDSLLGSISSLEGAKVLYEVAQGKRPMPAMTIPMVTGFPLQTGSKGDYVRGGYFPSCQPRPGQVYWGSFNPALTNKWFLSGPFKPQADYITVDLLVDKKARLTDYRLNGLRLTLVDETTGQRKELLPKLAHTFPFVFRDWELVYARVKPGDEYRLESSTTGRMRWLAFGEPFESGRLTPLIVGLGQSGKLLCLCGVALLVLALGTDWLRGPKSSKDDEQRDFSVLP